MNVAKRPKIFAIHFENFKDVTNSLFKKKVYFSILAGGSIQPCKPVRYKNILCHASTAHFNNYNFRSLFSLLAAFAAFIKFQKIGKICTEIQKKNSNKCPYWKTCVPLKVKRIF